MFNKQVGEFVRITLERLSMVAKERTPILETESNFL